MKNVTDKNIGGIDIVYRSDSNLFNRRNLKATTKTKQSNILDLMFADDCALIAKSPEALQQLLDTFATEAMKFGLRVNEDKTEIMYINTTPIDILMNGKIVKQVGNFKYLGSNIQNDGKLENEINHRVSAASHAFQKLYHRVWKRHEINLNTKLLVYKTVVLSTLLYSSETWTVRRMDIKRLDGFHMKCLKTLCKISWRDYVPNEEVLKRTKMMSIDNMIKVKRLRWAGHLSRMQESRIPHQVLFSELKIGKRPQKKPRTRWIDIFKKDLKDQHINTNEWRSAANKREEWRRQINLDIQNQQEITNAKAEVRRQEKHLEEDKFTWKCPICTFSKEGRTGRQYVNSHMSQAHRDLVAENREEDQNLTCTICNIAYKTKAGYSSHYRHKHPNIVSTKLQPIKCRTHTDPDSLPSSSSINISQIVFIITTAPRTCQHQSKSTLMQSLWQNM